MFSNVIVIDSLTVFSASFFHELWKRKQAEIEYDWDVADFEQEEVGTTFSCLNTIVHFILVCQRLFSDNLFITSNF